MTICKKYQTFKELANLKFASYKLEDEPPENEQFAFSENIWNFQDYSFYQNILFYKYLKINVNFDNLEKSFDWINPKKIDVQPIKILTNDNFVF